MPIYERSICMVGHANDRHRLPSSTSSGRYHQMELLCPVCLGDGGYHLVFDDTAALGHCNRRRNFIARSGIWSYIESASCCASVCQYVSISWLTGSLKQPCECILY